MRQEATTLALRARREKAIFLRLVRRMLLGKASSSTLYEIVTVFMLDG